MELARLRPLGNLEKFHAVRHHLRLYTSVAVTATYRLPPSSTSSTSSTSTPDGRSLRDDTYRACELVIQQHPNLAVNIDLEGPGVPCFVRLPEINLDKCIFLQKRQQPSSPDETLRDREVDEFLQTHHATFFDPDAPLWKFCILEDSSNLDKPRTFAAAFIFHHAIGDGISAKVFHAAFAQALYQVLQLPLQKNVSNLVTSPLAPLPPTLEEQIDLPLSIWFLVTQVFKSKFPSKNSALWAGGDVHRPLINRLKHLALPESTSSALRKSCSTNGATITAFLQILVARLLFKQLDAKYTQLNFQGSISARRWASSPEIENMICDFIVDYEGTYHREALTAQEFPWSAIAESKLSLSNSLERKGKNRGVGLLRWAPNPADDHFIPQLDKPRNGSYEISNIGTFKTSSDHESTVSIGRMIFTQCSGVGGSAICVSAITGGDGCLALSFSWQDNAVDTAFVELLMTSLEGEIAKVLS